MRFKQPKPDRLDRASAEGIAAGALEFLTADPARLVRFLADTGLDPQELAASLAQGDGAGVLSAALDHIASDESLLLVFAASQRRKPEEIMLAQALLQGTAAQTSM